MILSCFKTMFSFDQILQANGFFPVESGVTQDMQEGKNSACSSQDATLFVGRVIIRIDK